MWYKRRQRKVLGGQKMKITSTSRHEHAEEHVRTMIKERTGSIIAAVLGDVQVVDVLGGMIKASMRITPSVMEGPKDVEVIIHAQTGKVIDFCFIP